MFSFFVKKDFLVDYLDGFVDIHNHILPGIDDGAKTVDEAIELIKAFGEFGVCDFICTPHIMNNYYENTPSTIKKSYYLLQEELKSGNLNVQIDFSAEHMIDDNFENILDANSVLPLGELHLLVEMSYLQPSINFESSIKKIQEKQLFPILAHPERYAYYHQDFSYYDYLKSLGVKFQLNMLSLSGYYGREINKIALKLLEKGMYDFIGSDAHRMNHINNLKRVTVKLKHTQELKKLIRNPL